jgi:hypothetical protein
MEPSPNDQMNRYGGVPPDVPGVPVKVTGLPTAGDAGLKTKPAISGSGEIIIVVDPVAVLCTGIAESVAVTLIV